MSKITCFDAAGNVIRQLYQWDRDVTLVMSDVEQYIVDNNVTVHFANKMTEIAYVVQPTVDGTTVSAAIPNALLQRADTINAYLYTNDGNGEKRTRKTVQLHVSARPMPEDYGLPIDDGVIHVRQGDSRPIGFIITDDTGATIIDTDISSMEIMVGDTVVEAPYDSQEECFVWNMTQAQTLAMPAGETSVQVRLKFTDDSTSTWESCDVLVVEPSRSKEAI